eukprot:g2922.t1
MWSIFSCTTLCTSVCLCSLDTPKVDQAERYKDNPCLLLDGHLIVLLSQAKPSRERLPFRHGTPIIALEQTTYQIGCWTVRVTIRAQAAGLAGQWRDAHGSIVIEHGQIQHSPKNKDTGPKSSITTWDVLKGSFTYCIDAPSRQAKFAIDSRGKKTVLREVDAELRASIPLIVLVPATPLSSSTSSQPISISLSYSFNSPQSFPPFPRRFQHID